MGMKRLGLLTLSLVMVLSLAACGGDRGTGSGTNGGTTNGITSGTNNGATSGTNNGTNNSGVTGNGSRDDTPHDIIGSDLDDMVKNGTVDDRDGNLNREP